MTGRQPLSGMVTRVRMKLAGSEGKRIAHTAPQAAPERGLGTQ